MTIWFEIIALVLLAIIARMLWAIARNTAELWGQLALLRGIVEGRSGQELLDVVLKR